MKTAFLHISQTSADGTKDTFHTIEVPAVEKPLPWQIAGFTYTASGYGSRIPTRHMVLFNGKWRRVYVRQYSNIGTVYIGKLSATGENIIVRDYQ